MFRSHSGGERGGSRIAEKTRKEPRAKSPEVYVYAKKYVYKKLPEQVKYIPNMVKVYDANSPTPPIKVVVFDLDDTIGHFPDLYRLWNALFTKHIYRGNRDPETIQQVFNELLDLYPEFLRYGILPILQFLKTKIRNGESRRIYLYTNNQCDFSVWTQTCSHTPTEWVEMIIAYLNRKLAVSDTIFGKPVCAFKINEKFIEPLRESHAKTHSEFLKCTILPKNTEICFVDDQYYEKMNHDKVYYVRPPPYYHNLSRDEIIDRFVHSELHAKITTVSSDWLHQEMPTPMPTPTPISGAGIDSPPCPPNDSHHRIYSKMMYYIKEFFCMTVRPANTRRKRDSLGRFTRKKR